MTDAQMALNILISVDRYLLWLTDDSGPARDTLNALKIELIYAGDVDVEAAHDYADKWAGVSFLIDRAARLGMGY